MAEKRKVAGFSEIPSALIHVSLTQEDVLPMKCLRNEDFVESNFGGFLLQVFELPELLIIPERILEFRFHNLCVITIYSIILLRK